jgi:putative ABC transport system substrate-binding protein
MIGIRRREFITLLGGAAAWPLVALAQQGERVRRIGMLTMGGVLTQSGPQAFREGMAKLGWIEGRNLQIDLRNSDGPHLAADADALVNLRPEVIFALNGAAARAAQQATKTIPIVFVGAGDPTAAGLTGSVARPTGNATGFGNNFASQGGKWLELLKGAAPRITKVARIYNSEIALGQGGLAASAAAAKLGITMLDTPVRNPGEIERAITAFAAEPGGGLLLTGPYPADNWEAVLQLAVRHRLPTMYGAGKLVAPGLLMSNGPDSAELSHGAASYVDRILRGAKPNDLPIQYPTKFPLVINLKTAKAIGLDIPATFLALADEVIE